MERSPVEPEHVALQPIDVEACSDGVEGAWEQRELWRTSVGLVTVWQPKGSEEQGPVRVAGDVPELVLPLVHRAPTFLGAPRDFEERALRTGLALGAADHEAWIRMPRRGFRRSRRTIHFLVDDVAYTVRPQAWRIGASELVRLDGTIIWRHRAVRSELLSDEASPIEVALAVLCSYGSLHRWVSRNVLRMFVDHGWPEL